ncbi:MAG: helix-turn-helix transcriptional regulator [Planctomycetota bacterium]
MPMDSSCLDQCMFGQALDGMCVGLILTSASGRVDWLNRSAQRMLGIEREEALGQRLSKVLRDPNMAEFWHQAGQSPEVLMGEVSLHWPKPCELKANASICVDEAGACIGRALLFCDVTAERMVRIQLSKEATSRLMQIAGDWQGRDSGVDPQSGLTGQELRILRLLGEGQSNEEIAKEIHVARSTVRSHLKHLYAKLGLASRSEAIRYAVKNGF